MAINPIEMADGIEILADMAKAGKIDAWNIDIIDVTDKYLQKIAEIKSNNLRLTGRTLFFAAVLLKLKSDILEGIDILKDENSEENFLEEDYDYFEESDNSFNTHNIISLEDALERRTSVRLNKKRVVTLKDLIKHLEFYEELEKKRSLKSAHERAKRRVRNYANFTPDDIIDMAHDEYIENNVEKLHQALIKLFETNDKIELGELVSCGLDKITIYIALLFLSARSRIGLHQEEFYSDLYVVQEG